MFYVALYRKFWRLFWETLCRDLLLLSCGKLAWKCTPTECGWWLPVFAPPPCLHVQPVGGKQGCRPSWYKQSSCSLARRAHLVRDGNSPGVHGLWAILGGLIASDKLETESCHCKGLGLLSFVARVGSSWTRPSTLHMQRGSHPAVPCGYSSLTPELSLTQQGRNKAEQYRFHAYSWAMS